MGKRQNNMSQLFQFKSATATSIEYSGSDYLYIINNIAWTNIDIDTIGFGQLLDIVGKVNNGEIYALRRTRLFDALDVKLGTDVSGNYAPSISGSISEWVEGSQVETDGLQIRKINVIDSEDVDIVSYDDSQKQLNFNFSELSGSIGLELDSEPGKIKKLVIENDNNNAFSYNDVDSILTFNMGGINGKEGFVCITNIQAVSPSENIGNKIYTSNGKVLEKATGNATNINVSVLAITGKKSLKPSWVRVNGLDVTLTQHTVENLWVGNVNITVSTLESGVDDYPHYVITAEHSEGAIDTAKLYPESAPVIDSVVFLGDYPLSSTGQTAYTVDRTVQIRVDSEDDFVQVEIVSDSNNACKYQLTATFLPTTTKTITGVTAGANATRGVKLRIKNATGTWSSIFDSSTAGTIDHINTIKLDNNTPTLVVDSIDYPGTQQALKNTEQAEILYTYTNTEEIEVQSIGTDLNVATPNPSVGGQILVNRNSSGSGYNISSNNLRIIAKKLTNDTSLTVDAIVQIADSVPSITLSGTHTTTRLRSGGNNGTSEPSYAVTIHSNQRLQNIPTLTPGSGGGELTLLPDWTGTNSGDGMQYSGKSLKVHDLLTRGEYEYTISGVLNLAGRTTTTITSGKKYTIGGFVSRNGYFTIGTAFSDIGVNVSNFNNAEKLVVKVLSLAGTYVENTTNVNYSSGNHIFTIVSTTSPTAFEPRGNAIRLNEENVIGAISTSPGLPYTIEELD